MNREWKQIAALTKENNHQFDPSFISLSIQKEEKPMNFQKFCFALLVFTTVIAIGPASAGSCSVATASGVWGYISSGFDSYGLPRTSVAQATVDNKGNLTGWVTVSDYGTIVTVPYTGTVSISKKCTGSFTLTFPDGSTRSENFVMDDNKKGYQHILTGGGVESGYASVQGPAVCGLTGKKQTFAVRLSGYYYLGNNGPVAIVGQETRDGKGNLSGTVTLNLNGMVDTQPFTGTYTENANCTGTEQIIVSGGYLPANFSYVVVNGGKEKLTIETDSNTVVSGTAQQ